MDKPDDSKTKPENPAENGVPDEAKDAEPKGRPTSDRQETETAAG